MDDSQNVDFLYVPVKHEVGSIFLDNFFDNNFMKVSMEMGDLGISGLFTIVTNNQTVSNISHVFITKLIADICGPLCWIVT